MDPRRRTLRHADGDSVAGDGLLLAAGLRPLTGDLGLETVGLEPGAYVPVDAQMRAPGTDWLYAVGDVNGRAPLTHQGKYQGRVAVDGLLARARGEQPPSAAETDEDAVPQVIFTDPEVGAVGLSSRQAAARGLPVRRWNGCATSCRASRPGARCGCCCWTRTARCPARASPPRRSPHADPNTRRRAGGPR